VLENTKKELEELTKEMEKEETKEGQ